MLASFSAVSSSLLHHASLPSTPATAARVAADALDAGAILAATAPCGTSVSIVSEDDGIPGIDPTYQIFAPESNGFPGYSPSSSGTYTRDSMAIYAELSGDVTDKLFMQGALRYEDYSDFDAETVWKIAGRYEINDVFALRSSIGTGFRAPTPGQQGTTNVSTRLPNGFPVATGLFPASGPVAQVGQ